MGGVAIYIGRRVYGLMRTGGRELLLALAWQNPGIPAGHPCQQRAASLGLTAACGCDLRAAPATCYGLRMYL